jgi:hypothetical protein
MYEPNKKLGEEEPKKPGLMVAIKFDPKKRLGDEEPDGEEPVDGGDPDKLMDDACVGICKALNVSPSAAPRLRQYLEAFFTAADSKPHVEGEHENEIEDSKE